MKKEIKVALCVECVLTEDDEQFVDASGLAVFGANGLGEQMGYKPGSFTEDDCLGVAQMMAERLAEALEWAELPSANARLDREGGLITAVVNPGSIGEEAWGAFKQSFIEMCAFYGGESVFIAEGRSLQELLSDKLAAASVAAAPRSAHAKAPKA